MEQFKPSDMPAHDKTPSESLVKFVEVMGRPPKEKPAYVRKEHLEQRPFRSREMAQLRSQLAPKKATYKNRKR